MTEKSVIKLENVWKIYQLGKIELPILKGISLEIPKNGFVTIMGPSGSGKSTLLNIVGCLDTPTKGRVFLDGKDISKFSQDELAEIRSQKIGFIFQQFNLFQNLSAVENVMIPMIFRGIPESERIKRAKKLLTSLNMGERINHKPSELSGGEQQRIAIARALANDPEVILADEPTGNLDSSTGKKIMESLIKLHTEEKKTIIVITHDPTIAGYSHELVNIKDGQIVKNHQHVESVLWKEQPLK